jgi:PmbA protein
VHEETDLKDLALDWVERGRHLIGDGTQLEVFIQEHAGLTVRAYNEEVEGLRYSHNRGAGVRAISEGRLGYAYTTGLDWADVSKAIEEASANARYSSPDENNLLPGFGDYSQFGLEIFDAEVGEMPTDRKVEMALELERLTREQDSRITQVESAVYADTIARVAIANSTGVSGSYRSSDCYCYVSPIAKQGDESQSGFSFDQGIKPSELDLEKVAKDAAERTVCLLGSRSMASERLTLILDSFVAAEFLGLIASALSAEAVLKGRSFLAGKVGERIADSMVTLIDDGLLKGGPSTAPFDDEGVPSQCKALVSQGVLEGYLYDTYTASRAGTKSTGNASRGSFRDRPHVGPSNLYLKPGSGSRKDILRRVGEGVLILQVVGAHAGANPVNGEISLGALGLKVEGGEVSQPLREITLAGTALDFLRDVVAIGEDMNFLPFAGSLGAPTVAVENVMIAGRG